MKIPAQLRKQLLEKGVEEDQFIHYDPDFKIQKWDVFGHAKDNYTGMIIAKTNQKCPIWKDKLPFKSVTVVCKKEDLSDVEYWLCYVHGGSFERIKDLPDGKVALRSNYQAW